MTALRSGRWSHDEIGELELRYPHEPAEAIARDLRRPRHCVYNKAAKLGLRKSEAFNASPASGRKQKGDCNPIYRRWTKAEDKFIRDRYPNERAASLAPFLGRSIPAIHGRAKILGVEKSETFWKSDASGRIPTGNPDGIGKSGRFPKGHAPANKGLRRPGWHRGRMRETQFTKGHKRNQWKEIPLGGYRLETKQRIWLVKVRMDGPSQYRWKPLARLVWERERGPIPKGYVVRIRGWDTKGPESPEAVTIDRLECLSMADNLRQNSIYRFPEPIVKAIKAKGYLSRAINKATGRTRNGKARRRSRGEHDLGTADAPVRDD